MVLFLKTPWSERIHIKLAWKVSPPILLHLLQEGVSYSICTLLQAVLTDGLSCTLQLNLTRTFCSFFCFCFSVTIPAISHSDPRELQQGCEIKNKTYFTGASAHFFLLNFRPQKWMCSSWNSSINPLLQLSGSGVYLAQVLLSKTQNLSQFKQLILISELYERCISVAVSPASLLPQYTLLLFSSL